MAGNQRKIYEIDHKKHMFKCVPLISLHLHDDKLSYYAQNRLKNTSNFAKKEKMYTKVG